MPKHLIVVEDKKDWSLEGPGVRVVNFQEYLLETGSVADTRVINLCRGYQYLSSGYYCSLMAEARGQRALPSIRTISDLSQRALYSLDLDPLRDKLDKLLGTVAGDAQHLNERIYFGQAEAPELQELGRQIFELLPAPILTVRLSKGRRWRIDTVRAIGPQGLKGAERESLEKAFYVFGARRWSKPRSAASARFELAMLVNPDEKLPPSNKAALNLFIQAGRELGIDVEMIGKNDLGQLGEYDGLFIRETTQVDHHTYQFAKKAEAEGMVVMDDPTSILRCTNKIYLADLLRNNKVPAPRYQLLSRDFDPVAQLAGMNYPVVVKIPDGSFSRGVFKAGSDSDLREKCKDLFRSSSVLLAQEYVYTDYDWRVGILNRKPIFAARYFMSKGHWQIYKHRSGGRVSSGDSETLLVEDAPQDVVACATQAAGLIGDGIYGVDLKQVGDRVMVIEVNDNPSIDHGCEDAALGKNLYRTIMSEFQRRLEARVARSQP